VFRELPGEAHAFERANETRPAQRNRAVDLLRLDTRITGAVRDDYACSIVIGIPWEDL
jgi:hypothetical protein